MFGICNMEDEMPLMDASTVDFDKSGNECASGLPSSLQNPLMRAFTVPTDAHS